MGKLYFVPTLILIVAAFGVAQTRRTSREVEGFRGNVKSVTTESAQLVNKNRGWVEGKRQPDEVVSYDLDGNRMKGLVYDDTGNPFQTSVYTYSNGDGIVKEEIKSHNSQKSYKFKYKFDDKGRRIEDAWYRDDGSLWLRYVRIYDEKDHLIEWVRYTPDGKVDGRSVATYDAVGNEIEKTWFKRDGSISEKWSCSYELDSKGNWVERRIMKWVKKNGKSFFEPHRVTYRQIEYF